MASKIALRLLGAAPLLAAAPAWAQASEQAVKAAFLPKFVRYVQMPEPARPGEGQPYYLCVIGRDPFGALLDRAAASELVDGHPVAVRRFADIAPPAVAGCHIAYLAGHGGQETAAMLAGLRERPLLTVTDARSGQPRGIIHFVLLQGRVRFHIDDDAAASRGIAISSRLLALAIDVKQRMP